MEYAQQIPGVVGDDLEAGMETAGFRIANWHIMGCGEYEVVLGNLERGRSLLLECIERVATDETELLCWSHAYLTDHADLSGSLPRSSAAEEGRRHALEAMRFAERNGGIFLRVSAYRALGVGQLVCGDPQDAREALETGLALARDKI